MIKNRFDFFYKKPFVISALLILATSIATFSLFLFFKAQERVVLDNSKKINAHTQSPNDLIKTSTASSQKLIYIQANLKAEKFVPKILNFRASIPYWDQPTAFASFKANVSLFNYTTVFWYTLRADGGISKYIHAQEDPNIINFAHQNNVKIFGLIANLPDDDEGGSWDYKRVEKVISTPTARNNHINEIVALIERVGFDGISIDYEELETYQKNDFTTFIKELASALHEKGKLLGVAIHPKSGEGKPSEDNGSAAQDLVPLSLSADQLYFMTYGEHWDDSKAGPIASLSWVKSVINYALSIGVPRKKVFMGIPLYGLDWPKYGSSYGTAEGLTFSQVTRLITVYKPAVLVDSSNSSAHFDYSLSGQIHEVWFENSQTVESKLDFAKSLGISVTFWRLGGEDSQIWPLLRNYK